MQHRCAGHEIFTTAILSFRNSGMMLMCPCTPGRAQMTATGDTHGIEQAGRGPTSLLRPALQAQHQATTGPHCHFTHPLRSNSLHFTDYRGHTVYFALGEHFIFTTAPGLCCNSSVSCMATLCLP